jgi:hypothetical protein
MNLHQHTRGPAFDPIEGGRYRRLNPMSDPSIGSHYSAASSPEHVAAPISSDAAAEALRHGPRGALLVAGIAVALLMAGWLAFYFLLFRLAETQNNPLLTAKN